VQAGNLKMKENKKYSTFNLSDQTQNSTGQGIFSVPAGYFEELETEITSKVTLLSSLEHSGQENHFAVPANYFENFPITVSEKLANEGQKSKKLFHVSLQPQQALTFASFLLLLWFSINTRTTRTISLTDTAYSIELSNETEYLQYIDEYTIVDLLANQTENQNSSSSSDSYIQYLLDNDIEISQIENNL